jgi:hypothetical protein
VLRGWSEKSISVHAREDLVARKCSSGPRRVLAGAECRAVRRGTPWRAPTLPPSPDKAAPKPIRKEQRRAAIGAGCGEWDFTGSANAAAEGQGAGEDTPHRVPPEENFLLGSQTPSSGCLRHPATAPFSVTDSRAICNARLYEIRH